MALVYTAKVVTGMVNVLSADGQTRVLRGDTLSTGAGASAQLVADDASLLDLQNECQIKIDDSMLAETAPVPGSAALAGGSLGRVIEALTPRDELSDEVQAKEAAGGDGCGFVRLPRVSEVVNDVDNKSDKMGPISSMKDGDAGFFALPDLTQADLTVPGPAPVAPLLLSDVLTSEAEVVFEEAAPGLQEADQVESICIDLNTWAVQPVVSVRVQCHPSAGEG